MTWRILVRGKLTKATSGSGGAMEAPPIISYAGSPFSWPQDLAIAAANVTVTSGVVSSYAIQAGSLPASVVVNAATGQLTGTPADPATGSATIRATGPSGLVGDTKITWEVTA